MAQQLLARCLQDAGVGRSLWPQEWNGLAPFDRSAEPIVAHHLAEGFVQDQDDGMLFVGAEAEKRFGHRHFAGLTAVFTAPPQFTVIEGLREIGRVDPSLLTDRVEGPRLLLLAGRSWRVTWVDWRRRRCFVEPADRGGRARWVIGGPGGWGSFALTRSVRDVLLGDDPPVRMTVRARAVLATLRSSELSTVHPGGLVITDAGGDLGWWTWAGFRANATLAATVSDLVDAAARIDDVSIRLRNDLTPGMWRTATADVADRVCLAEVDDVAVDGLKFSEALPARLAVVTLAARLTDLGAARTVLDEPVRFVRR